MRIEDRGSLWHHPLVSVLSSPLVVLEGGTKAPIKLWVSHIHLAVLSFETEIMRATTVGSSMALATAMSTIPNAVAFFDRVTGLAIPRTLNKVAITRGGGKGVSGVLHSLDLAG